MNEAPAPQAEVPSAPALIRPDTLGLHYNASATMWEQRALQLQNIVCTQTDEISRLQQEIKTQLGTIQELNKKLVPESSRDALQASQTS